MSDGSARLRATLDEPPADAVSDLDDEQADQLATLVERARRQQAEELEEAIDEGLSMVPRMLRGAVKKAVF